MKEFIGEEANSKLDEKEKIARVRKVKEGADAPLTEQINMISPVRQPLDIDVLPESTGVWQGDMDPLQRFINMYQPSELVLRVNFRKHLLQILEDWKHKK